MFIDYTKSPPRLCLSRADYELMEAGNQVAHLLIHTIQHQFGHYPTDELWEFYRDLPAKLEEADPDTARITVPFFNIVLKALLEIREAHMQVFPEEYIEEDESAGLLLEDSGENLVDDIEDFLKAYEEGE